MLKSITLSKEVYTKEEVEVIILKVQEEMTNEELVRRNNSLKLLKQQFGVHIQ